MKPIPDQLLEFLTKSGIFKRVELYHQPLRYTDEYSPPNLNSPFIISIDAGREPYQNYIIALFLTFEAIDSFFETNNPHIINKSFEKKIKGIVTKHFTERLLFDIYKCLLVFRNCIVHHKNKISIDDGKYLIAEYDYNNTYCFFMLNIEYINYVCTFSETAICKNVRTTYEFYMFNYLYDCIKNNIYVCKNDIDINLKNRNLKLESLIRYEYFVNKVYKDNDVLTLSLRDDIFFIHEHEPNKKIDYMFEYNGQKYYVPEEAVTQHNTIKLTELHRWMV